MFHWVLPLNLCHYLPCLVRDLPGWSFWDEFSEFALLKLFYLNTVKLPVMSCFMEPNCNPLFELYLSNKGQCGIWVCLVLFLCFSFLKGKILFDRRKTNKQNQATKPNKPHSSGVSVSSHRRMGEWIISVFFGMRLERHGNNGLWEKIRTNGQIQQHWALKWWTQKVLKSYQRKHFQIKL